MANKKDGVSVQEIENFGKKYKYEVFFSILFILATVFSMIFGYDGWSVFMAGIGAVLGAWLHEKIAVALTAIFNFVHKQELVMCLVFAGVICLISVVFPPIIFFCLGAVGGKSCYRHAMNFSKNTHR